MGVCCLYPRLGRKGGVIEMTDMEQHREHEAPAVFIVQGGRMFGRFRSTINRRNISHCACCEGKWRRYKMENKKYKLLPYEVIEKAVAGENE